MTPRGILHPSHTSACFNHSISLQKVLGSLQKETGSALPLSLPSTPTGLETTTPMIHCDCSSHNWAPDFTGSHGKCSPHRLLHPFPFFFPTHFQTFQPIERWEAPCYY